MDLKKLTHRIWHSATLMTWGNMVTNSIKLLVLTPLILIRYDINEIAFWYLLLTINSFVIVIDFGFYPTFSRIISYAYHGLSDIKEIDQNYKYEGDNKPDWNFISRIFGTVNSTYLALGIIVFFVVLFFTSYSVHDLISKAKTNYSLTLTYVVYSINIFVYFFTKKYDAVIIGTNHVALINRWNIIFNLVSTLASILVVYFRLWLLWLAVTLLIFNILLLFRDHYLERKICDKKFRDFKYFSFDKEIFRWCWSPTWKSGVLILCSTGVTQATGIIYSKMSDATALAAYLISLKLVSTTAQFSQAPFYSKLPVFSGLRVKNRIKELTNETAKAMQKSLWVFVLGITSLFYFGNSLLKLIGSNSKLISFDILILMSFVWFFERNHAMHAQVYVTTNKIPFYKTAIPTAIANILLMIFLLPKIGIWAFPIAQGISNLMINNWWNMKISFKFNKTQFLGVFSSQRFVSINRSNFISNY